MTIYLSLAVALIGLLAYGFYSPEPRDAKVATVAKILLAAGVLVFLLHAPDAWKHFP